jgi:hypothetical protein
MSTPLEHRAIIAALAAVAVAGSMLAAAAQSTGEAGAQPGAEPLGDRPDA